MHLNRQKTICRIGLFTRLFVRNIIFWYLKDIWWNDICECQYPIVLKLTYKCSKSQYFSMNRSLVKRFACASLTLWFGCQYSLHSMYVDVHWNILIDFHIRHRNSPIMKINTNTAGIIIHQVRVHISINTLKYMIDAFIMIINWQHDIFTMILAVLNMRYLIIEKLIKCSIFFRSDIISIACVYDMIFVIPTQVNNIIYYHATVLLRFPYIKRISYEW